MQLSTGSSDPPTEFTDTDKRLISDASILAQAAVILRRDKQWIALPRAMSAESERMIREVQERNPQFMFEVDGVKDNGRWLRAYE